MSNTFSSLWEIFEFMKGKVMNETSIGSRIKQRRKELGLTQIQIKEITGISSGNMSEIESCNRLPSAPALISLSRALNCSIDWILNGEEFASSTIFLSNRRTEQLLESFNKLSSHDQDEIIDIIELKLSKAVKREATSETMSNAKNA